MPNDNDKLIDSSGQPRLGIFSNPIREINHADADCRTPMGDPVGRLARHFRLKQFQFLGVMSEEFVLGCAIVDIRYLGNAFVYLYDRRSGSLEEFSFKAPFSLSTQMPNTPDSGSMTFKRPGVSFAIEATQSPRRQRRLEIRIRDVFCADIALVEPTGFQPLAICTKNGFTGWTYTQKAAGLDIAGHVDLRGRRYTVPAGASASYDWSCGHMRRETAWNWACFSGKSTEGNVIGANFSCGVNETSFTENCFWINGKRIGAAATSFEFSRTDNAATWRIHTTDGRINLLFTPENKREEKLDAIWLASNFTQHIGLFDGTLVDDNGHTHNINGLPGFAEDHYARW